jgi:alkylhydroperoxidase/carboxymuconolactone decarboxylase family protein YurZ
LPYSIAAVRIQSFKYDSQGELRVLSRVLGLRLDMALSVYDSVLYVLKIYKCRRSEMSQVPWYIEEVKKHDPGFSEVLAAVRGKADEDGDLDPKTKTLIVLALDAAGSHPEGVKRLASRARSLGATKGEINEVLRLVFITAGVPGLVAGLAAFET